MEIIGFLINALDEALESELLTTELRESLMDKIVAAADSIIRGNFTAAINQLHALVNHLKAQAGKVDGVDAEFAETIIELILEQLIPPIQEEIKKKKKCMPSIITEPAGAGAKIEYSDAHDEDTKAKMEKVKIKLNEELKKLLKEVKKKGGTKGPDTEELRDFGSIGFGIPVCFRQACVRFSEKPGRILSCPNHCERRTADEEQEGKRGPTGASHERSPAV